MGSIIICDVIIAMFSMSFIGMKDCEHTHSTGLWAAVWSLITSACIIGIGYDSWWSVVFVALASIGGLLMFFNVNSLKITYHAMYM